MYINKIDETNINITLEDLDVKYIDKIINDVSNNLENEFSIISNIDLYNSIMFRYTVSKLIKYLQTNETFKNNITYILKINYKEEKYNLLLRDNILNTNDQLAQGIKGITYGTTIN